MVAQNTCHFGNMHPILKLELVYLIKYTYEVKLYPFGLNLSDPGTSKEAALVVITNQLLHFHVLDILLPGAKIWLLRPLISKKHSRTLSTPLLLNVCLIIFFLLMGVPNITLFWFIKASLLLYF